MKRTHRSSRFVVAALALTLAGCSDNGPAAPESGGADFTDAASLLAAQASAIASMDADRYTALLEASDGQGDGGYRFYPSPGALSSLSWLDGDSWSYAEETTMMSHLLNPAYVSDTLAASLQRMECSIQVQQAIAGAGGTLVVDAMMDVRATMTQGPAIALQQPVTLELAQDANGFYRIRSMRELAPERATTGTWTGLMAAFRGGPRTPAEVIAAHADALTRRDYDAYVALLHPDFEYVPQSQDLGDLPWITPDDPWSLEDELPIIAHMFDPDFVSQYDPSRQAVQSIQAIMTPLNELATDEGTEVATTADIQVLWSANSGAFAAVRFVFLIVADDRGQLRIRRIEELPDHSRVESASWATVKAAYR